MDVNTTVDSLEMSHLYLENSLRRSGSLKLWLTEASLLPFLLLMGAVICSEWACTQYSTVQYRHVTLHTKCTKNCPNGDGTRNAPDHEWLEAIVCTWLELKLSSSLMRSIMCCRSYSLHIR